jgi:DNA-binding response OmpR family regulator
VYEGMLSTPLPSRRLLIADDHHDGADILAMWLGFKGFDVRVAYDGEAAIKIANSFEPEALILDFDMPKCGGIQVARQLRALAQHKFKLFIALTGRCEQNDLDEAATVPFDAFLVKPCRMDSLLEILNVAGIRNRAKSLEPDPGAVVDK